MNTVHVRVTWIDPDTNELHTKDFGLLMDGDVDTRHISLAEPHLWFKARDNRVFGLPSKDIVAISAVPA